ncbi:MAG: putative rane protein [Acidobacteriaceae bacterium]|nr:putative rane protein [Acidobacteriaceae bacterium]
MRVHLDASRLPQIDWLRALAALGVFVFHVSALAGFPKLVLPDFSLFGKHFSHVPSVFTLGATGVNLFFVLSGFCLALQQWRRGEKILSGRALQSYARNRAARIVPAYWAAVILSMMVAIYLSSFGVRQLFVTTVVHLLFLHGFDPHSFLSLNAALWSMAIEVQFYVCFPMLLRLYQKLEATKFLFLLGSASMAYRLLVAALPLPTRPFGGIELGSFLSYQIPGRILEFALGMWLADVYLHRRDEWKSTFAWVWMPLLPAALWCRAAGPRFMADPVMGVLYCAVTGFAIFYMGALAVGITSFGEARAAAFGRASYSFFLIHLPVLDLVARRWPADYGHPYASFGRLFVVGFLTSAVASAALYHGVELPLWKRMRGVPETEPSAETRTPSHIVMIAATPAEQQIV